MPAGGPATPAVTAEQMKLPVQQGKTVAPDAAPGPTPGPVVPRGKTRANFMVGYGPVKGIGVSSMSKGY